MVGLLGGKLLASHINGNRMVDCFGKKHEFWDIARSGHIAKVGISVDVQPGGDLAQEIVYGNHSSVERCVEEVRREVIADLVRGGALAFLLGKSESL